MALPQLGTVVVFDVVNGADKSWHNSLLAQGGKGIDAEAILGMKDVVVLSLEMVVQSDDKFLDALLNQAIGF